MYRIFGADKDAYITNRVIKGVAVTGSNVGLAGSLDLFKLYGMTFSGSVANLELSRLLIHFNTQSIKDLHTSGSIDITNPSFNARLRLFDVYGGQPTPSEFTVNVYPLSRSFTEGLGKDVVFYSDHDSCNYASSSWNSQWVGPGASSGGLATDVVDYITSASNGAGGYVNYLKTQYFANGDEDLNVDVTSIVSSTIKSDAPDSGYVVRFSDAIEADQKTYFVKRFGTRHSYNEAKRPQLIVKYDDSIQDDTLNLAFNVTGTLFLYNYVQGALSNLVSGSTSIIGNNCIILRLSTPISGGTYQLAFTGSQHAIGSTAVSGVYSASVAFDKNNAYMRTKLIQSGCVQFTPIWCSFDSSVSYLTSSAITVYTGSVSTQISQPKNYIINVLDTHSDYYDDEDVTFRLHIFDQTSPMLMLTRQPIDTPGSVIRDVHWSIRDAITNQTIIPFDVAYNSTRCSSDSYGMFFKVHTSALPLGRTYVFDALINNGRRQTQFRSISPTFRVSKRI
jgi:hypothetical protein